MKTRRFSALLAALLLLSLAGCQKEKLDIPTTQTGSEDFQKNMHQSTTSNLRYICETEDGIYFQDFDVFAYYLEKKTNRVTILCGKPDCEHKDKTCNAYIYGHSLWFYGGKLYFTNRDGVIENGNVVDYGDRIYSIDPDGTNRKAVQNLEFTPNGETSKYLSHPIMHRGVVYFPYCGVLYAAPLGGNIEDAEKIWGTELENSGMVINKGAPSYELWADGDTVYFMVNLEQADGTYKDTLFAYDTAEKSVTQVWQTPDKDEVGEWVSTGVSVSQWYVMGGYIYFYLSGGDYWRSNLSTGRTEKLAETHEKAQYGSAIFTDDYLCLLNDSPDTKDEELIVGNPDYIGGDTIYLYRLNGEFVKELSLKSLYEKNEDLTTCKLCFCTGGNIYFLADAGTWSDRVGAASHKIDELTLCCVNIETGEITQIYNWH